MAIRCLDEGIDIPVTDHALIIASSTVEREYIQRRGRVLRRSPDKLSAEVHDVLLVDAQGGALTRSEALRALEFARLSRNPAARERLRALVTLSSDPIALPQLIDEEDESDSFMTVPTPNEDSGHSRAGALEALREATQEADMVEDYPRVSGAFDAEDYEQISASLGETSSTTIGLDLSERYGFFRSKLVSGFSRIGTRPNEPTFR